MTSYESSELMIGTIQKLEDFHRFAMIRWSQAQSDIELDELMLQWYDSDDSEQINATIRQGLADMDSGLGKPADDVSSEMRAKFDLLAK